MGSSQHCCVDDPEANWQWNNNNSFNGRKRMSSTSSVTSVPITKRFLDQRSRQQAFFKSIQPSISQIILLSRQESEIMTPQNIFKGKHNQRKVNLSIAVTGRKDRNISWENITIQRKIAKSQVSEIFLATFKLPQAQKYQKVAVKKVQKNHLQQSEQFDIISIEKRITQIAKSPFITQLLYVFRDPQYYYLVMEWAQKRDVQSYIRHLSKKNQSFQNSRQYQIRFILGCLILGLQYLQELNIEHKVIKPENLLIFQDGYVKIGDFGFIRELINKNKSRSIQDTSIYSSPELIKDWKYGKQADLWNVGVIAYELANLVPPFQLADINDKDKYTQVVIKAENNRKWQKWNISIQLKSLINDLLKLDPRKRLGANGWKQVKNHNFFKIQSFSWQQLQQKIIVSPLMMTFKQQIDNQEWLEQNDHTWKKVEQVFGDFDSDILEQKEKKFQQNNQKKLAGQSSNKRNM